ncbi:hypothetical protein C0J52_06470 [Blattella germanica]|nr:hypothetical protein C0J52_06470 [Blattella germanica]
MSVRVAVAGGRRCIGRPRKRWLEDIEEDIREGIRTWRRRPQDRGEWAAIVRQALFLSHINASESVCRIRPSRDCQKEEFGISTSSESLGQMELKAYPYKNNEEHPVLNITFSNIHWSVMRFRFSGPVNFCREFDLSPKYKHDVKELFYDCFNTVAKNAGHSFLFEYAAEDENKFTQIRKFALKVPVYKYINDNGKITLLVGIVGCVVLLPVFLFVLWMWRRQCQPPEALIERRSSVRTNEPQSALVSAGRVVVKNNAGGQDPWTWCNDAFDRADYVMIISSPPKCCSEEGVFRNMDLVALRFLKEMFSKNTSKSFFSVLLPYCTEKDIPKEVQKLRVFKLTKDLDKMLWYIHNGGKAPSFVDSVKIFLDRKPHGGKSDLNIKGACLLTAFKEAGFDQVKVCSCMSKKIKESDDDAEDERANFVKMPNTAQTEHQMNFVRDNCVTNNTENDSMSSLLIKSESSESNCELPDELTHGFPVDILNNLLGESENLPEVVIHNKSNNQPGFNIQNLSL